MIRNRTRDEHQHNEGAGPRFWPSRADDDADFHASRCEPSLRWLGLRRAWRTTGHVRAALAVLTIGMVIFKLVEPIMGQALQGPIAACILFLVWFGVLALLTTLMVTLLLAFLQVITGWPLHDADRWFPSLPWYGQIGVFFVLLPVVCIPAIIMVIASIGGAAWMAGLLK